MTSTSRSRVRPARPRRGRGRRPWRAFMCSTRRASADPRISALSPGLPLAVTRVSGRPSGSRMAHRPLDRGVAAGRTVGSDDDRSLLQLGDRAHGSRVAPAYRPQQGRWPRAAGTFDPPDATVRAVASPDATARTDAQEGPGRRTRTPCRTPLPQPAVPAYQRDPPPRGAETQCRARSGRREDDEHQRVDQVVVHERVVRREAGPRSTSAPAAARRPLRRAASRRRAAGRPRCPAGRP